MAEVKEVVVTEIQMKAKNKLNKCRAESKIAERNEKRIARLKHTNAQKSGLGEKLRTSRTRRTPRMCVGDKFSACII